MLYGLVQAIAKAIANVRIANRIAIPTKTLISV